MVDPHAGQPGTSRPGASAGRWHPPPQILQVKFPEAENVKRRPPVAIQNCGEWFLLILFALGHRF
jgi:hypothetical protein